MARNAEKAMAMLSRWVAMKKDGKKKERRPYIATECNDLKDAEHWRQDIIKEISRKVAQIQNAGLGEFRIRDLNDEINKLLRERRHWEDRIVELGGPDYQKVGPKMLDYEGKELPNGRGYKYFGAAKELPGVRELFEQEPPAPPRKTRTELAKGIDANYYGYRDEDDGVLVPLEAELEQQWIAAAVSDFENNRQGRRPEGVEDDLDNDIYKEDVAEIEHDGVDTEKNAQNERFTAHVPVPSQKEVEDLLVRRKQMELLEKYASEVLIAQSKEAKTLLGV